MYELIGKKLAEAKSILTKAGKTNIEVKKNNTKRVGDSDAELVVQARLDGDKVVLVTSQFLLNI